MSSRLILLALLLALLVPGVALAQDAEIPRVVVTPEGKVRFQTYEPYAAKVELGGEMNDWNPSKTPMTKGETGVWFVDLALEPKKYGYKFVVDGSWEGGDNKTVSIIRGKNGVLEVLPDQPAFNSPYNSKIYFGGRAWTQAVMREQSPQDRVDTGRWRFAPLEYDLGLRMRFTAGENVTGFAELNLNRTENRYDLNFEEGEATYTGDNFTTSLFHRRRIFDLNDPLRLLDPFRDTFDDKIYFTGEARAATQAFGRKFEEVRIYRGPYQSGRTEILAGWQGGYGKYVLGPFTLEGVAADDLVYQTDLFAGRLSSTWLDGVVTAGISAVCRNEARGVWANTSGSSETATLQRNVFTDVDGGVVGYPPGSGLAWPDDLFNFRNYDMLAVLDPDGANRDAWYAFDVSAEAGWWRIFLEAATHKKDWGYLAYEDGDETTPGGAWNSRGDQSHYYPGEYVVGGSGEENTIFLGAVWKPTDRFGIEFDWRYDDASELAFDTTGALVRITPYRNTYTLRTRYTGDVFDYATEYVRRPATSRPRTFVEAGFDPLSFQGIQIIGATDQTQIRQTVAWRPLSWLRVTFQHAYEWYEVLTAELETREFRGSVDAQMTQRLRASASGRLKYYYLPNNALTTHPGSAGRFFSPCLQLRYAVSPHVTLSFNYGVDHRLDEDLEEGHLFFLRRALAEGRRSGVRTERKPSHTLDQILFAEEMLEDETRFELELDARF